MVEEIKLGHQLNELSFTGEKEVALNCYQLSAWSIGNREI